MAGRRFESQPAGTSQRYDLTHCHPGQARIVYQKSQSGGSRAPTIASDCDAASLAFQNVCFLPNLAQADDHRAKASERYCAR
jgi:hypothetical protein